MLQEILGNLIDGNESAVCGTTCVVLCPNSCVGSCLPRENPRVEVTATERINVTAEIRVEGI